MDEYPYSMNEFTLTMNDHSGYLDLTKTPVNMSDNANNFWKYEEDKTLKEVEQYLASTYHSHYTSEQSKTQTLDLIESIGDAEAFTRSNAIKYLSRFGKKNGKSKMDILKAIHYCVLLYHFSGLHTKNSDNYETF
jgi:acetate kinase